MPRAHTRLAGFAECALDEGRYFATIPHNAEEARTMMKREVLQAWEDRVISAQSKIEESLEPELERLCYELEIAQRLLVKAQDEATRETWQSQVDVLQMMIGMTESELTEHQEELSLCEAMIAEIASGELDAGILWGPVGGYYAQRASLPLSLLPLVKETAGPSAVYAITLGVRPDEPHWKHRINKVLA